MITLELSQACPNRPLMKAKWRVYRRLLKKVDLLNQIIKAMEQRSYQGVIVVNAPLQVAFDGVRKRVAEWWTKNIEGNSENIGDSFTTTFGETFATFKVIEG